MSDNIIKSNVKIKTALAAFVFCMILMLPLFAGSSAEVIANQSTAAASAGTADDPLVTLSWVNKSYTPQVSLMIEMETEYLLNRIKALENTVASLRQGSGQSSGVPSDSSGGWVIVEMAKGEKLRSSSGVVEFIMRPGGEALVLSRFSNQGLADLTVGGGDLMNGEALPENHIMMIMRPDDRGFEVTTNIAYIIVRGDYEVY